MRTHQNPESAEATALLQKVSVATGLALFATASAVQASTDYGPAIWRPLCNANYYSTGSGHKFHVIHDMEGYYASVINWFDNCSMTSASIHYAVNGKKDATSDAPAGEITQLGVRDSQYAWHARCWNTHSTGTEHEGFASNPAWYTDAQYQASAGITANLANKFGWAKDRNHIVGHNAKTVAGWSSWASANLGIDPNCNSHSDPGAYWDWAKYMSLVNPPAQPPVLPGADVSSRGAGQLDVFVRGADNAIWSKNYNGVWGNWYSLGGTFTSDPAAVSWDANRIDVFGRGSNGEIYTRSWTPSGWGAGWASIGGGSVGGPDVSSWGAGRLDVFIRGKDNALWHNSWAGSSWLGWQSLGGIITSDPAAVSWAANRIDVFARGNDGAIWSINWNGTVWSVWYSLGGACIGSPTVSSWGPNRLDVFVRGTNNALYQKSWDGSNWMGWYNWGGDLRSDPGAVSWGANRIDVFARGADNAFWSVNWNGSAWSAWYSIGGN